MSSNNIPESEFMRSLGKYRVPELGENLRTQYGKPKVTRILSYDEVLEEMRENGVSDEEIERFDLRVENFLGNKERYFECELTYPDGEVDRIDWSEYLAMKNKRKR